jgi:hypothetical protein
VPERLHVVFEWRDDGRAAGQFTDAQIERSESSLLHCLATRYDADNGRTAKVTEPHCR